MDKDLFYLQITSFLLFTSIWLLVMDFFLKTNGLIINMILETISLILVLQYYRGVKKVRKPHRKKRK